jgi:hypothetical protein
MNSGFMATGSIADPSTVKELFALLNLNSEVWILVLVLVVVLVLDQSAFSTAKRARLSRNYFVQLV